MPIRFPHTLVLGLTVAAGSLPPALSAQTTFGLTAGVVAAKVSYSPASTNTEGFTAGFAGGITMSHAFSKVVAFAPEILYVQKGYDQNVGRSGDFAPYEEIARS